MNLTAEAFLVFLYSPGGTYMTAAEFPTRAQANKWMADKSAEITARSRSGKPPKASIVHIPA